MRQRKLKNEEERLAVHRRLMPEHPEALKGKWHEAFGNDNPIYIEFGCGKGKFITAQAELHPDRNYIGIEGQGSVILRALEKTEERQIPNVLFTNRFIKDIKNFFDEDELSGIYLNFSDPWPKLRHEKKRLTHRDYLEGYRNVMKPGGVLEFKTDNEGLFAFTMEEIQAVGANVLEETKDLHNSNLHAREVSTEYEEKFKERGLLIHYCKVILK